MEDQSIRAIETLMEQKRQETARKEQELAEMDEKFGRGAGRSGNLRLTTMPKGRRICLIETLRLIG